MKSFKKLLAGVAAAALLVSVPAAFAASTPGEADLLDILDELYSMEDGGEISFFHADVGINAVSDASYPEETDIEHTAAVTIGEASAGAGGTVEVPVSVSAQMGVNGVQMTVSYDSDLTYIGAVTNSDFTVNSVKETNEQNTLSLIFANAQNLAQADRYELATLKFKVKSGAIPESKLNVNGKITYVTYRGTAADGTPNKTTYSTVQVENGFVEVLTYLLGDTDGDGEVTTLDAIALNQHLAKIDLLEGNRLLAGDVDGDGEVTSLDAIELNQYLAKMIDSLG